jgi:hypothetical protein
MGFRRNAKETIKSRSRKCYENNVITNIIIIIISTVV